MRSSAQSPQRPLPLRIPLVLLLLHLTSATTTALPPMKALKGTPRREGTVAFFHPAPTTSKSLPTCLRVTLSELTTTRLLLLLIIIRSGSLTSIWLSRRRVFEEHHHLLLFLG